MQTAMRRSGAALVIALGAGGANAFDLGPPIDCAVGVDCFVQQYVDLDPGPGVRDYQCGAATYDGHKGVDFALRGRGEMEQGVAVLAAAAGRVKGLRDGEPDDGVARPGRDCGNGVVLDHGDGWETQYCHLRQGSVAVGNGDAVARGDVLGLVGWSGNAEFPHVHLSVRKDGAIVDPFRGREGGPDCGLGAAPLWADDHAQVYGARPAWVNRLGLWPGRPDWTAIDGGAPAPVAASAPLVAFAELRNLPKDWRMTIALISPDGATLSENVYVADRHKARWRLFAGRKAPAGGWPAGAYRAQVQIVDGEGQVTAQRMTAEIAR